VKRNVALLAGAAALALAVYFGSRLGAQAPAQAPAQTRIAVINMVHVITNYHKFKTFQDELGRLAKPYKEREADLQKNLKAWQGELEKASATPQQREEAEKQIKERKRQIEDNATEAKKILAKRNDEQFVILYREVEDAIKKYAVPNGFHMVMQFNEPPNPSDLYNIKNIYRKLEGSTATGCCAPVYVAPGLDITKGVLDNLNAGAPTAAAPPAGAPAGAPAAAPAATPPSGR
jgi:Skp family chaperone for outer membrane proteins